ncbi:hypothetical protein LQV05_004563 [Cryptococcus neoformans]|nr:hypothetical protein C356_04061 [Cryptococcus neoformans var. grubii c45]OXC60385.1 hypothetical protein C358_04099 [Cryptococcus neoformans var. grubii MW-RSA852]UOH81882.1 hypothetical protein LQV05_004563 [Cryptococcus neoformans]
MARKITVAAAQVGAVHKDSQRSETLSRLIALLEEASKKGVQVLVYPETTFTTFFPRWKGLDDDPEELDRWFEHGDITDNPNISPLVSRAKDLGIDIVIGYGEKTDDSHYYNTCSYIHAGKEVSKYRKVHLPGNKEPYPDPEFIDQLEKRYFEPGDYGFKAFRVPNLAVTPEDGEAIAGMMNADPEAIKAQSEFQHLLVMQAHSYTNATFSIAAARAGFDDGKFGLIGCSCIVHPEGHIIAQSKTMDDELVVATIDLDDAKIGKQKVFNFGLHRQPHQYSIITQQAGVVVPPCLS